MNPENFNPEKSPYPLGTGGELEKIKETAALYQVDNRVEYVNLSIKAPFHLVEGAKTDLGLFLSPVPKEEEAAYNVEIQKYHGRAGLLGRAIIQDNEGRMYRDIDAKGIGYLSDRALFSFSGTPGILNYEAAIKERNVSEAMLKLGLRASRVLTIIRLNEIFDREGNRISIEEAKKKEAIRRTDEPVVEIRLMGTNARIQDLAIDYRSSAGDIHTRWRKRDLLLEDAKRIVSQEFGRKPEEFSLEEYMDWFADTLGQQVAIMHCNGWIHTGLTDQNITLDGRIVDFATAEQYSKQRPSIEALAEGIRYSRDIERAARSLRKFCVYVFNYPWSGLKSEFKRLVGEFTQSYLKNLELPEEEKTFIEQKIRDSVEWGMEED